MKLCPHCGRDTLEPRLFPNARLPVTEHMLDEHRVVRDGWAREIRAAYDQLTDFDWPKNARPAGMDGQEDPPPDDDSWDAA